MESAFRLLNEEIPDSMPAEIAVHGSFNHIYVLLWVLGVRWVAILARHKGIDSHLFVVLHHLLRQSRVLPNILTYEWVLIHALSFLPILLQPVFWVGSEYFELMLGEIRLIRFLLTLSLSIFLDWLAWQLVLLCNYLCVSFDHGPCIVLLEVIYAIT